MLKNPKIVKIPPATAKSPRPKRAAAKSFDVAQVCSVDLESDGGVRLPPLTLESRIQPEDVADARFRLVEARSKPVMLSDRQFDVHMKRLVKVFMSEVSITRDMREITSKRSLQPADRQLLQDLEILKGKLRQERCSLVVTLSKDSRHRCQQSAATDIAPKASNQSQVRDEKPPESADEPKPSTGRMSKIFKRKRGGAQPKVACNPPIICSNIETPKELSQKLMEKLAKACEGPAAPDETTRKLKQRFAITTDSNEDNDAPQNAAKTAPTNAPAAAPVSPATEATSEALSRKSSDIFYDFPVAIY
ncbi:uncharacterized protein LOC117898799 [Drosophila subobscura]|uniref:uncharacterized protein LOC117898799 n=1 Tax=Drosophila subobscura TaxID=7241 RepID=UPI00155B1549|nr:uncharacterized protein LOC117898799 [Drosophila subobscura]